MTVGRAVLVRGAHPQLYRPVLDDLLAEMSRGSAAPLRVDLTTTAADDPHLERWLSDDGAWMEPVRTLVLDGTQAWKAASLNVLLGRLSAAVVEWHVVALQHEREPVKTLRELVDEELDHRVDDDVVRSAKVLDAALRRAGVEVDRGLTRRLIEHAGAQVADAVAVVSVVVAGAPYPHPIGWPDVRPHLDERGSVSLVELFKAISAGDREGATVAVRRGTARAAAHPLQVVAALTTRYRTYLHSFGAHDADELAARASVSRGAAHYALKEARRLGQTRCVRSFAHVAAAERDLKGDSALDAQTQLEVLVVRLAQQFRLAGAR